MGCWAWQTAIMRRHQSGGAGCECCNECLRSSVMVQAMHHYGQPLEVLFYEVLDMPLREYEQLKHMKARSSPAPPLAPLPWLPQPTHLLSVSNCSQRKFVS